MTVAEAWMAGREHLAALGLDEASITAEVLLRHALSLSRTDLYLAWGRPVGAGVWTRYQELLAERARGRPVAYITGHREFMGLDFLVDERVLIPRPETEVLVETMLAALHEIASPTVADVGTGSGAIAVSLAVLRPDAAVVATDLSFDALDVARANATRHGVAARVRVLQGDLLTPLIDIGCRLDGLACNPPYVSAEIAQDLQREIQDFEPRLAIVAPGGAGRLYARLADDAPLVLKPGGWLAVEVAAGQAPRVVELLEQASAYEPAIVRRDSLGWDRVVAARVCPAAVVEGIG
jgi:release factor glutamine methyltransferase